MTVRQAIGLIKRHDSINVVINERKHCGQEYKRSEHSLKDILINNSDNVEIILGNRVIEIPVNEVKASTGVTSAVFYENSRIILFNY